MDTCRATERKRKRDRTSLGQEEKKENLKTEIKRNTIWRKREKKWEETGEKGKENSSWQP